MSIKLNTDLDHYCMRVAVAAAVRHRSFVDNKKGKKSSACVGCAIRRGGGHTTQKRQIIAIGWNEGDHDETQASAESGVRQVNMCAERNALAHPGCAREGGLFAGATVYTTHMPCWKCAQELCRKHIGRVVYLFWRHDIAQGDSAFALFRDADISCIPLRNRAEFLLRDMTPHAFDKLNSPAVCMLQCRYVVSQPGTAILSL